MIACFLSNISAKYYKNPSMLSPVIAKNVGDVFLKHSVNIDGLSAVQTHHQLVVVRQWSDITPSTTHHRQNLLMTCGLRHSDDDDAGWETWHSAGHCLLKLRETCSYVARLSTVWYVCVRACVCVRVKFSHTQLQCTACGQVPFVKNCGVDDVCTSKLHLKVAVDNLRKYALTHFSSFN